MATGGIAQSMSVSDRRRLFELNSGSAGSSNAIHDSLRKTKPTLTKGVSTPNITVRATTTTTSTSESTVTRPAKKNSIFSRRSSKNSNSTSKKVNRASSDADAVETKRSKYQSSPMDDSPKHTKSNETSPTHSESASKRRREPPRPPSQVISPQESPKHRPQASPNGHKELKQDTSGKSKAEKPARPPSPKRVVRDKDLEITLSDGGCVCWNCGLFVHVYNQ